MLIAYTEQHQGVQSVRLEFGDSGLSYYYIVYHMRLKFVLGQFVLPLLWENIYHILDCCVGQNDL